MNRMLRTRQKPPLAMTLCPKIGTDHGSRRPSARARWPMGCPGEALRFGPRSASGSPAESRHRGSFQVRSCLGRVDGPRLSEADPELRERVSESSLPLPRATRRFQPPRASSNDLPAIPALTPKGVLSPPGTAHTPSPHVSRGPTLPPIPATQFLQRARAPVTQMSHVLPGGRALPLGRPHSGVQSQPHLGGDLVPGTLSPPRRPDFKDASARPAARHSSEEEGDPEVSPPRGHTARGRSREVKGVADERGKEQMSQGAQDSCRVQGGGSAQLHLLHSSHL